LLVALGVTACSGDDAASDDDDGRGGSAGSASSGTGASTTSGTGSGSGTGGNAAACANGPLADPIPGCAPPAPPSSGDVHQDCVDRINQFRWECQCLPPLERWTAGESCTDQQSADDQQANSPHGNFPACGENAQNTCPNWGSEGQVIDGCLQMMWDEGPGMGTAHGHYNNMTSNSYGKVACGFSSGSQGVWSNQNFAP
jgi:hypothetical protein